MGGSPKGSLSLKSVPQTNSYGEAGLALGSKDSSKIVLGEQMLQGTDGSALLELSGEGDKRGGGERWGAAVVLLQYSSVLPFRCLSLWSKRKLRQPSLAQGAASF